MTSVVLEWGNSQFWCQFSLLGISGRVKKVTGSETNAVGYRAVYGGSLLEDCGIAHSYMYLYMYFPEMCIILPGPGIRSGAEL